MGDASQAADPIGFEPMLDRILAHHDVYHAGSGSTRVLAQRLLHVAVLLGPEGEPEQQTTEPEETILTVGPHTSTIHRPVYDGCVDESQKPEPLVQTNDTERDKRIWAEGFLRALAMLQEAYPSMSWPEYYVTEELEANPYATPQAPSGKLLEALQDRDALLGALGPYALQMACSAHPEAIDSDGCGKCHNCRARALYSPIIKWIRKGYRRAPTSA